MLVDDVEMIERECDSGESDDDVVGIDDGLLLRSESVEEDLDGDRTASFDQGGQKKSCSCCTEEVIGFWIMGALNNVEFVITNAGAKDILATGVALVYFCNVFPSFVVKGSASLWFHLVPYRTRIILCSLLTFTSLTVVALGSTPEIQLLGVTIGAFAGALGEATFLAFSSHFTPRVALTSWSSGTGAAGVLGYLWVVFFVDALGLSFRTCLLIGNIIPVMWLTTYFKLFHGKGDSNNRVDFTRLGDDEGQAVRQFTVWDRITVVFRLWEMTLPLLLTYFFEYALQSGSWAAYGFPIEDKDARDRFYVYANWCYQVGVFISRSSGTVITVSKPQLWLMPLLQFSLLTWFTLNGIYHIWWNNWILSLTFGSGLLGGTVYVHGFILISKNTKDDEREMALASASVADTMGIMLADIFGLMIQGCLYGVNHITDNGKPPVFRCGYDF